MRSLYTAIQTSAHLVLGTATPAVAILSPMGAYGWIGPAREHDTLHGE